jgi:uncharacterized protein YlxW (UPF0749 family)
MSVFSANINHRSFYWQISAVCFVLGVLLAAAAFTAREIARSGTGELRTGFFVPTGGTKFKDLETENRKLLQDKTELERALAKHSDGAKALSQELQETKLLAGLTEVAGPGVQVTLTDSQKKPLVPSSQFQLSSLIHDTDIASVVNELKASGAEAVSVNGQRVVSMTAIRCVGPVVHVNGEPAAPPYIIQAVGDQDAMYGGLNLPGGALDGLRQFDPTMIRVEKKGQLRLSALPDAANTSSKDRQ